MENKIEIDIIITPENSGKNKVYSISSIQFPNIVTQGETIEQAKARLKEALELYFEDEKIPLKKISPLPSLELHRLFPNFRYA